MYFSNMCGLGTNSVNLGNYGGTSQAAFQILQQFGGKNPWKEGDTFNQEIANAIMTGDSRLKQEIVDGKTVYKWDGQDKLNGESINTLVEQAQKMISCANGMVSQQQQQASVMKSNYENNVSIWLEAQQEQLEAQKEWEMDLLAEEQSDMEAEKNSIEVQLQRVQEEKKNVEQALGNAIQDSAPKFGLA